jgi:nuclear pore complex protein Nup98-Nup96
LLTLVGGGAFGANNASTGAFGQPKPAAPAFGAFGGATTGTFGSTGNAFGAASTAAPAATGGFGQPSSSTGTGAFGGSGVFGAKTTNAFGATTTTTGALNHQWRIKHLMLMCRAATGDGAVAPVTTGSSNPPYAVFQEKDTTSSHMLQYQSISAMPAYRGTSFEVCP